MSPTGACELVIRPRHTNRLVRTNCCQGAIRVRGATTNDRRRPLQIAETEYIALQLSVRLQEAIVVRVAEHVLTNKGTKNTSSSLRTPFVLCPLFSSMRGC